MDDDLGALQHQVWDAVQRAATVGDANALSILGPIAGEMKRKYQEWRVRFQQLDVADSNGHPPPRSSIIESAPGEDFTGKSIRGFEFEQKRFTVGTYKEMLVLLAQQLLHGHPDQFEAIAERVRGQRAYFSKRRDDLRDPRELKPGFYIETNFPANQAVKVTRALVEAFGYASASLRVDIVPFRTRAVKRTAKLRGTKNSSVGW